MHAHGMALAPSGAAAVTLARRTSSLHNLHVAPRRHAGAVSGWHRFHNTVVRASKDYVQSRLAFEETIGLILQQDCDIQLQRCLNTEAYGKAQEIRSKRMRLDEQIKAMEEKKAARQKGAAVGPKGAPAGLSAADIAAEGLRLRTEMQRAVEEERYKDASQFRDLLADLETESKRLSAMAAEWTSTSEPKLRLGQRVKHTTQGYRGVVVGWDLRCCETDEWVQAAGAGPLVNHTFYLLAVDVRDWPSDPSGLPPMAYAAEPSLTAPELETPEASAWVEVHGDDPLRHPFLDLLFLGRDGRGDYVPSRHLRNKYNAQRRDVFKPGEEPSDDE